jgi:apolipoprotein N-acyltransferase
MSTAAIVPSLMATSSGGRIGGIAMIVLPWLVGGALSLVAWTEPTGKVLRTSIVQAGVSQDKKWERDQRVSQTVTLSCGPRLPYRP